MKSGRWLFLAGMVFGTALGVTVGMWGGRTAREDVDGGGEERRSGGRSDREWSPETKSGDRAGPGGKSGSRMGGGSARSAGVDGLLAMIGELSRVNDMEEVNFMELIRQANTITQMSEGEIGGLMDLLDSEEMDELIAGGEDEFKEIVAVLAMARMAEVNGPEAMRRLMAADEDSFIADDREEFAAMCMTSWVAADPKGALAWMNGAQSGEDELLRELTGDPDFSGVFAGAMARADRDAALKFADEAEGDARVEALTAVARHEKSAEGIKRILESTGENELNARREVVGTWSERSPQEAAAWLDAQPEGEGHAEMVKDVAQDYLRRDPAAGAEWYMKQEVPAGKEGERYQTVVQRWAYKEPEAAGEWLLEQPDGPDRDDAELGMAEAHMRKRDWNEAFEWAGAISDEVKRGRVLDNIVKDGMRREGPEKFDAAAREAGYGEIVDDWKERQ